MSCALFSRMSMVPAAMTDFVVLLPSPLTGMGGSVQDRWCCKLCLLVLGHVFIVAVFVAGGTDTCRVEFVLGGGVACIYSCSILIFSHPA